MARNNNRNNNNRNNNNHKQQQAKQEAKQSAASGHYTKSNTQALRQAGVSKERIQNIKGVKRDTKAAERAAAEARENPTYQGAGFQDAIQNQVAGGGTVGQQFYDSLDAGVRGDLTSQQVADYAMSQGYGLGDKWQADFGTKTEDAQTLKQVMKGDSKTKLGALLKIASGQGKGNDFVDNKEFRKIYKYFDGDKNGLKITNKMDKINAKQAGKDGGYNPMGLQVGTLGKISKGKYGDKREIAQNNEGKDFLNKISTMGDDSLEWTLYRSVKGDEARKKFSKKEGPLSQLALNYKGSNLEGVNGKQGVYGADANGNAIFSPGQGGKSWSQHKLNKDSTSTYSPWATGVESVTPPGGGDGGGGAAAPMPEETPGFGSGGVGDGGEKNALTFRHAKSRWKNNGRAIKGTSNLKFSRSSGFGGFGASAATF